MEDKVAPQFNLLDPRERQMRGLREVYISFIIQGRGWGVIYVRRGNPAYVNMNKVHSIYSRNN